MHPRDAWINRFEIVERCLIDLRSSLQLISALSLYFVVYPEMRYSSGIFTVVASFLSITLILKGENCLCQILCRCISSANSFLYSDSN